MRRFVSAMAAALLATGLGVGTARAGGDVCVGGGHGCHRTLQAALDAARDGDTIRIAPGTYPGGATIDKSVRVHGAGAGRTIIRGGGPVLTIGTFGADSEPTVLLSGLTITGGVTRSSALAESFFGDAGVFALGGGIEIPPSKDIGAGATVTVEDSVIAGNRVSPRSTVPSGLPCGDACPFGLAGGGGIDSWGALTLRRTSVRDNLAGGSLTSDANGAGIDSEQGGLTIEDSVVAGNRAVAPRPYGRFAEGGGILVVSSPFYVEPTGKVAEFTLERTRVSGNTADLSMAFPSDVEAHAQSGAVLVGGDDDCTHQPDSGCVEATIRGSSFTGNSVSTRNSAGDAIAFSGAINEDGLLDIRDSAFAGNSVSATATGASVGGATADSGGLGIGGQADIARTLFVGNSVEVTARAGDVSALAGGLLGGNENLTTTLRDGLVKGNHVSATTRSGSVTTGGGGVAAVGLVDIRRTIVSRNRAAAEGPSGTAHGGGILNTLIPDGPSVAALTLFDSLVTRNRLTASAGIDVKGGGLFSSAPLTLRRTLIAGNRPDQCVGC